MTVPSLGDVTRLLAAINRGDSQAESELIPMVYNELRRLAGHYMRRERPGHTLQATALVHEAYMRLVKQQEVTWQDKAHFFAIAGTLMRRILVDYARARGRSKREGKQQRVPMEDAPVLSVQSDEILDVDRTLDILAKEHPRQKQIVELHFFSGLTFEEIAEVLRISPKTVKRDWSTARLWLHREIRTGKPE